MADNKTSKQAVSNIILCGFMGTGKSTVGRIIAGRLAWHFVDTDRLLEDRQGRSIAEIIKTDGEPTFRQLENQLCVEITHWTQTIIATGGGMVVNPANRANLECAGLVVCLEAPTAEILARLKRNTDRPADQRPMLSGDLEKRVPDLLAARAESYAALPYHLNTAGCLPAQVAQSIIDLWKRVSS